ncbi:hypothetical protein CLOBAR_01720 [Intestinibacter bartlettii DSM 16795]|nr:hypothetical protein CLOBAR_01720 [Intestinibacter bartlettii DSM 16795]
MEFIQESFPPIHIAFKLFNLFISTSLLVGGVSSQLDKIKH